MRATGNGRLVGSLICFITVLALLAPGRALADDLLTDPEGSTEGVVEDTVEDVEGVVEDTVEDVTEVVTEVVNEASETADDGTDEVTTAVDDVVNEVNDTTNTATNDVTQVGDATNGITGTVGGGGSSGSDNGGNPGAQSRGGSGSGGRERAGFLVTISRAGDPGSRRWEPVNPLGVGLTATSAGVLLQSTGEDDRCEGPRSVCLDLLFGLGEFVKLGADVLGFLATTGIGVIGLMVIAFVLGISGSVTIVAARDRSSSARHAG
jgi:gas vesicle protein